MSEAGFTLFQNTVEDMESILYACCLTAFFHPFMTVQKNKSPAKTIKMLIVFLIYVVMYFINMAVGMNGWICMIVVILLLTMASGYLGMERKFAFLLGVLFFCIRNLCALAVTSINFYMGRYFVQKEVVEDTLRISIWNFCLVELMQMVLFTVLLYRVACQLKKSKIKLHTRELCYLLLTPVTSILFVNIIFRMILVISDSLVIQLYEQYPALLGVVPMTAALFYAGILVTRMEEVEQFYDGIRRMKHEMKNHLTNIKGLFDSGNIGEMEKYFTRMNESMDVFEFIIKTGNGVTDVIVNDKQKSAEKYGIRFQSEFIYPKSEKYNAYDIGIIVNNLLQNALEACVKMKEENRYISISSRQKKKFYLIEVRNSYEGEIIMDTDTNLPISTKGNGTSVDSFLH